MPTRTQSIAQQHATWLSLIEISGPFLSTPVLEEHFPHGLDKRENEAEVRRRVGLAYEEWLNNQGGPRPDPAIHEQWLRFVLEEVLEIAPQALLSGQDIPATLSYTLPEYQETLRPQVVVRSPFEPEPRLLVQLYPRLQDLNKVVAEQRWKASPATRMAELLRHAGVRLGLVTNGRHWMLVDAPRDETTGYYTWDASLWTEEELTLRAFRTLLGMERFFNVPDSERLEALLAKSAQKQEEVTNQLGDQVRRAVETLVRTLDRLDKDSQRALLEEVNEKELYEAALTVMMRLVFLLSAEEREMLLLGDPLYEENYAISTIHKQLQEQADQQGEEVLGLRHDAWSRLLATFRVVYGGAQHQSMSLPAYGGNLFNPDRYPFLEGRRPGTSWRETPAEPLLIDNRTVLHLLRALQFLQVRIGGMTEARRLSFRALDIEQIGHVYEGLLDHTARRAETTILGLQGGKDGEPEATLDELEALNSKGEEALLKLLAERTGRSEATLRRNLAQGLETPQERSRLMEACDNKQALFERVLPFAGLLRKDTFGNFLLVTPGSIYVTHGSDRRSTGTHYTPRSLTEPLVQHALDPLVYIGPAEGLPREEWQLRSAAEILDLKICDLAMGSGAFLVQACRYLSEKLVEAWDAIEHGDVQPAAETRRETIPPDPRRRAQGAPLHSRDGDDLVDNPVGDIHNSASVAPVLAPGAAPATTAHVDDDMADTIEHPAVNVAALLARAAWGGDGDNTPITHTAAGVDGYGQPARPLVAPAGQPSRARQGEELLSRDIDERLATARRIVAERCLYGVDKNPMAVEMAKLSLWLITLAKNKPFTFLDSNLRCGDSLLGVNLRQLRAFSMDQENDQDKVERPTLIGEPMREALNFALPRRRAISMRLEQTVGDVEEKERKLREADEAMQVLRLGADLLVAQALYKKDQASYRAIWDHLYAPYVLLLQSYHTAQEERFTETGRQEARAAFRDLRAKVDALLVDEAHKLSGAELSQFLSDKASPELQQKIGALPKTRTPFHWPLEFPEVFAGEGDEAGFAATVGNPPFQGGQKITGVLGTDYRDYLVEYLARGKRGSADLCAYFFLRATELIRAGGMSALLATNTIAEGDTRETGLEQIVSKGGTPIRAIRSRKWPGEANLEVAHVWFKYGNWQGTYVLDDVIVKGITPFLTVPGKASGKPYKLVANANRSFQGSIPLGMGFVLEPTEAHLLITKKPHNKDVLFPYLNGEDLNSRPDQSPSRWTIYFRDWLLEKAEEYPNCLEIIQVRVKPERELHSEREVRAKWWLYKRPTIALYTAIEGQAKVLVCSEVTKHLSFCFVDIGSVYSSNLDVFVSYSFSLFSILQSTQHDVWARLYCSQLETRLKYSPGDGFETFPFPKDVIGLESIGKRYHTHRQSIMLARQEGLTKTYNRFHNPAEQSADIVQLRELHREMDEAVARAYGWEDLRLEHGFHETKQGRRYTISEEARREVLDRLLLLNHQRHAEEVAAGLVDENGKPLKGKAKGTKSAKGLSREHDKGAKGATSTNLAGYWTSGSASGNGNGQDSASERSGEKDDEQ